VKNLICQDIARRLEGVEDLLLVNVVGMNADATFRLRKELREKNIRMMVVKTSLARRACEGTRLAAAFEGATGPIALVWGGEDFVSLAKEITRIVKEGKYEKFEAKGGVFEGERLTPEHIEQISKWPNRQEQLSRVLGQILSPGARLAAQILGPGSRLASQIEQLGKDDQPAAS
jgi:ribosomal protein L10